MGPRAGRQGVSRLSQDRQMEKAQLLLLEVGRLGEIGVCENILESCLAQAFPQGCSTSSFTRHRRKSSRASEIGPRPAPGPLAFALWLLLLSQPTSSSLRSPDTLVPSLWAAPLVTNNLTFSSWALDPSYTNALWGVTRVPEQSLPPLTACKWPGASAFPCWPEELDHHS